MRYDRSTFVSRLQNWVLGNVIGHSVVLFCLRMIILDGRDAAAPEDEKGFVDLKRGVVETSVAHRYKGRGLIGGLNPE